ncbi:MAG TPA: hypothetical protein VIP70_03940 [Nitrososphaeraceae archaeon]
MTSNSFLKNNRKTRTAATEEKAIASNAPSQTYEELSNEFQQLYSIAYRALQLIGMMYNRLTLVDKLSHKEAKAKIYEDHKHLPGFSSRNIRRTLTSLNNPNIPHRKIRPSWPNSAAITEKKDQARAGLDSAEPALLHAAAINNLRSNQGSKAKEMIIPYKAKTVETHACPNCEVLHVQNQELEEQKNKVREGLEQALGIIRKQEEEISELKHNVKPSSDNNQSQTNNDDGILECEVPLLYRPLQEEMASIFKLKENKVWLTIRFNKNTEDIIAVYLGRESQGMCSGQSIVTSYV